jgi:hypothetical protein
LPGLTSWHFFMEDTIQEETAQALDADWELQLPATVSKDIILKMLAQRAMQLLDRNAESFFQLMYRLDISERKLHAVLYAEDTPIHIAELIYDRQLQKIASRHTNKPPKATEDSELSW